MDKIPTMKVEFWQLPKGERRTLSVKIRWYEDRIKHSEEEIGRYRNLLTSEEYKLQGLKKELQELKNKVVDIHF